MNPVLNNISFCIKSMWNWWFRMHLFEIWGLDLHWRAKLGISFIPCPLQSELRKIICLNSCKAAYRQLKRDCIYWNTVYTVYRNTGWIFLLLWETQELSASAEASSRIRWARHVANDTNVIICPVLWNLSRKATPEEDWLFSIFILTEIPRAIMARGGCCQGEGMFADH